MTSLSSPPGQPVVRLSSPPEIVRAIPQFLGFHPTASVVVLGLAGPELRLRMTLRIDLPEPGLERPAAEEVALRLAAEHVSACVVVLFTAPPADVSPAADPPADESPADVSPAADSPADEAGGPPPEEPEPVVGEGRAGMRGASAAFAVQAALGDAGLDVRELLRTEDGRWWSYTCERSCCPPDGLPLGSGPTTLLEVLRVAAGRPVFSDRSAMVGSVERKPGEPTDALEAELRARTEQMAGEARAAQAARDLAAIQGRLTRDAARPAGRTDDEDRYDDRTVAMVAVALQNVSVRDASFAWTGGPLADAATALWRELVRRVPPPYAAAPATLLAVSAYREGDGVLADTYLRRALRDDPEYRMADLVLTSLENGFHPTEVESALGLSRPPVHGPHGQGPKSGTVPKSRAGTDARRRASGTDAR
ncbi:DUF4192 domain-containing protein [Cryptosporangium phraense]|uniref:DUF4192 domain-containing protein n=1 Tax=Cryptosporangium phraense TaxID=2593070 RepID=A0A545AU67_9ACTN|nr:DUF4192 domain-containing protein [Cryptosporangium phraense]TQS44864.1 DUF4192 domain-containing protein [Cryptosporangium phraense]